MMISTPIMSRNAVAMRTCSFAGIVRSSRHSTYSNGRASAIATTTISGWWKNAESEPDIVRRCSIGGFAERGRRHRAPDDAGERDDREEIRDHPHELRWERARALEMDLQRIRGREEEARECHAHRIPATEDHRRERDEPTSGRHLVGELMLVEREINAAESRE